MTVEIVDECVECASNFGDIDLSPAAFEVGSCFITYRRERLDNPFAAQALAPLGDGTIEVTWEID